MDNTTIKKTHNLSAIFLIPALQINERLRQSFSKFGFIDSYLFCDRDDCTYPDNITALFLLFKPQQFSQEFTVFTRQMEKNKNFLEIKDISGVSVMFVFKIPDQFMADYNLFLKGKYSKFSEALKLCFPMTRPAEDEEGNLIKEGRGYVQEYTNFYHIFNKTEYQRNKILELVGPAILPDDLDLYEIYNEKNETFKQ